MMLFVSENECHTVGRVVLVLAVLVFLVVNIRDGNGTSVVFNIIVFKVVLYDIRLLFVLLLLSAEW